MHQVLFPLVIVNILKQHGSKEQPLTITQIADMINRQYAPFSDREQVINRSTVARTLESLVAIKACTSARAVLKLLFFMAFFQSSILCEPSVGR